MPESSVPASVSSTMPRWSALLCVNNLFERGVTYNDFKNMAFLVDREDILDHGDYRMAEMTRAREGRFGEQVVGMVLGQCGFSMERVLSSEESKTAQGEPAMTWGLICNSGYHWFACRKEGAGTFYGEPRQATHHCFLSCAHNRGLCIRLLVRALALNNACVADKPSVASERRRGRATRQR